MQRRAALLAGAGAWLARLPARAAAAGFDAARLQRLSDFLDADTAPGGHLGAVVLLARDGRVLHWRAHGQRDLARREAMPRDAIFRIYSMSKPIASVAALLLMEEGRLTLDDPVARHLPEFAALPLRTPGRAPTLRHLLTHTAGFAVDPADAAFAELERAAPQAAADLAGFAKAVAAVPLAADPGTRFRYDGVHTEVLCRVVEVVAGQPFGRFLQQRLFDPLGMADTGFEVPAAQRRRIADLSATRVVGAGNRLELASEDRSAAAPGIRLRDYDSGAGGLYSTAADYARFAQMLLDEGRIAHGGDGRRLLARHSVALLRSDQLAHLAPVAGLGPGEGFGLGVSMLLDPARRGRLGSVGAYGWPGAATTTFTVDPQERLVALLLMQHLPRAAAAHDLARPTAPFINLVYQALEP
ncbi:MAG: beta-lactamase family protein [Proteobacteria bacterium]|nr:beta-lactamase family protein [Pseudomonadota bacterium]